MSKNIKINAVFPKLNNLNDYLKEENKPLEIIDEEQHILMCSDYREYNVWYKNFHKDKKYNKYINIRVKKPRKKIYPEKQMIFTPLYFNGKHLVVRMKADDEVFTLFLSSMRCITCEGKIISVEELIKNITLPNKSLSLKYYFDNVKFKYFIKILLLKLRNKIKSFYK
jgi:hypothetical protein